MTDQMHNNLFKAIVGFGLFFLVVFVPFNLITTYERNSQYVRKDFVQTFQKEFMNENEANEKIKELSAEIERLRKIAAPKIAFQQNLKCLADNIYYEAASEPAEGKVAVAQVTLNRTHESYRPHTICGVVYEDHQFSWTLHPRNPVNHKLYNSAVQVARNVLLKKERSDIIGSDVVYYHRVDVHPDWADQHEVAATIGNHIFYR